MLSQQASRTATMTALGRGRHRLLHDRPWVLDDPYALPLIGPGWPAMVERVVGAFPEESLRQAGAFVAARSRYAEDRLEAGAFGQFVILGAGLDSFAWRRPDLLRSLRVFEVDHPATQAAKWDRAAELGLPTGDRHVPVPLDFELGTLPDALAAAGFDLARPAFFSWLGVLNYLTVEAAERTLRAVAGCAPGTELVLDYAVTTEYWDAVAHQWWEVGRVLIAEAGEPFEMLLSPADAAALLGRCGLTVVEDLSRDDLHGRYFAGRGDGLTPYTFERLLTATRAGGGG